MYVLYNLVLMNLLILLNDNILSDLLTIISITCKICAGDACRVVELQDECFGGLWKLHLPLIVSWFLLSFYYILFFCII